MITFKPCVTYKRKDGTYAVRIRVTFARKSKYLATTLTAYPYQLTRTGKLKDGGLIASADALVRQMREAVASLNPFALDGKDVGFVCDYLRQKLRGLSWRLDYYDFANKWLEGKKESTAELYRQSLEMFRRHTGQPLDINDITVALLLDFRESYGQRSAAATRHLIRLGAIYAAARRQYNDDEVRIVRDPFARIDKALPPSRGQRSLGVEVMQRIISARPADHSEAVALAAFVVSFGTMGANFADLWAAEKFDGRVWKYERQKTRSRRADRSRMEVRIDARLSWHLALLMGQGRYWLPALHRTRSKEADAAGLNRTLRRWAEREGLDAFSFYAARHSWATIARAAGIEKATVDEGLAHVGDYDLADIYAERDWQRINEANARVLDLFSWEGCEA